MKVQLHQGEPLDVSGLDVVDACDVEEMVLVVVRQEAFHLCRIHAAIRLADVNHWQIEAREDVDRHLPDGQQAPQPDRNQHNHDGNWPP